MNERKLRANADYTVITRSPLHLAKGETITLGKADIAWPGWISITTANGRQTHLPENLLAKNDANTAVLTADFNARDLSTRSGDIVTSIQEIHGWHWCRNASMEEGWLPSYLLEEINEDIEGEPNDAP